MKVLVILLSDQHIPNLLSIETLGPDLIAYVETMGMMEKKAWKNLQEAMELHGLYPQSEAFPLENENSIITVKELFSEIRDRFHDHELIVNLTGGTKLMSIGAYEVFRETDARLIYKPLRYVNRFVDLVNGGTLKLSGNISTRQFLLGYGWVIPPDDDELDRRMNRNRGLLELAKHIAKNHQDPRISGCLGNLAYLRGKRPHGNLEIDGSDKVWTDDSVLKAFLVGNLGMSSMDEKYVHGKLSKHHIEFLTGGWLEVFIWGLISQNAVDIGVFDPIHSMTIRKEGVVNELDVVFLHGNTLNLIECKTGKQGETDPEAKASAKATLYKLKSIIDGLGANKTSAFLVTTSPNVLDRHTGRMRENIVSRAKEYGITIVTGSSIVKLAENADSNNIVVPELKKLFKL